MSQERVLSGMQASGRLHLGHLLGVLEIWKELQKDYDCFYFIADWHALSTNYEDTHNIKDNIFEIAVDWLTAGIDPKQCTIFQQSKVVEHAELYLLLSMITPIPWLERNPTYKEKINEIKGKDLATAGFLSYPILQAADILLYKTKFVPVGVDQLPHLEMTREIARRFNFLYKKKILTEPVPKFAKITKLLGTDGKKMSKSYNNAIYLSDSPEIILEKAKNMFTDPQRIRLTDPGNPGICNVFSFHKIYTKPEDIASIEQKCKGAKIGCMDCKILLGENIIKTMKPFHTKRMEILSNKKKVYDIIEEGSLKAKNIAGGTLAQIKDAMMI